MSNCKGVILFSGGYDSTALLHRLIVGGKFNEILVVFENSYNLQGEYERLQAKNIYNQFKETVAKKHKVKLKWESINVDIDWVDTSLISGRDLLLTVHLSQIIRYGLYENYYIGWNRSNIKELNMAKKLHKCISNAMRKTHSLFFLEDYFKGDTKVAVIKYLLVNNLFQLPHSSTLSETVDEYESRKNWFINNPKENEVARALIDATNFNGKQLSKLFNCKTTKEVQDLFNKEVGINSGKHDKELV